MQSVASSEKTDLIRAQRLLGGVGRSYAQRHAAAVLLPLLATGLLLLALGYRWPGIFPIVVVLAVVLLAGGGGGYTSTG